MKTPPPRVPERSTLDAGFAALRHELEISADFPDEVHVDATRSVERPPTVHPRAGATAVDLTDVEFVTIDPPTSMDLDQALHIEPRADGWRISYAIADPATFVAPGSPLDLEAHRRGLTMYAPDLRAPLYPPAVGEGASSLLPAQSRPSIVWQIDLDGDGRQTHVDVRRAVVRSVEKLSYAEAQRRINAGDASPTLMQLREVGLVRQQLERQRGGVSLQLPSQEVTLVDGHYELEFDESIPVEEWNAQISLLTGMAAADLMLDAGVGIVRTLPTPEPMVLEQIRLAGLTLGIDWPEEMSYPDRIRTLTPDSPAHLALLNHAVRALRGADYASFDGDRPSESAHWAIAADYAHVTAPLRRLCDRYANEVAVAVCAGERPPGWVMDELEELPDTMRGARRRERQLDRLTLDFVEASVLQHRVGECFDATVTSRRRDDLVTIQIAEPAIAATMRSTHPPGSRLEVVLVSADPATRTVRFEEQNAA